MTGDESKFAFLTKRKGGYVTFGDNAKGRIIGQGNIGNGTSSLIESVLLVDGLKHNLLSISQLCDKGFKVIFEASHCIIKDIQNDKTIFMGHRCENSIVEAILKKTPYELWKNKKPNISYFKVFGCKCFILNTKDNLGKFDAKSDVGIFLGYSTSSKAFRVFNKRTMVVEESIHVIFYESNNSLQERESVDDDLGLETSMGKLQIEDKRQQKVSGEDPKKEDLPLALPPPQQVQGESSQDLPKDWKFVINHPQDQSLVIHQVG
ncbi:hypothetical protein CK203_028682 [Vitis vinifera]|uniref:Retrovirus-related Pol polyprotein from transposon TNT 1-94 n=1 Tax=Vitis vinifera TaxID=29760 RepID=A0A438IFD6_VITVI|nr:hypothetical protein CK203_028682 [Vitis vinifera]